MNRDKSESYTMRAGSMVSICFNYSSFLRRSSPLLDLRRWALQLSRRRAKHMEKKSFYFHACDKKLIDKRWAIRNPLKWVRNEFVALSSGVAFTFACSHWNTLDMLIDLLANWLITLIGGEHDREGVGNWGALVSTAATWKVHAERWKCVGEVIDL